MDRTDPNARTAFTGGAREIPSVLLFDVYETLLDLTSLGDRFVDVGAHAHLARTWLDDGPARWVGPHSRPRAGPLHPTGRRQHCVPASLVWI